MIALMESSTRDDVLEAIYNGDVGHFSELPESYQTTEMALFLIETAPVQTILDRNFLYSGVPQRFRTDEFLLTAAKHGCSVLKDTKPEQTGLYREIACISIANSRYALEDLDSAFHDEEMLEFVYSRHPKHMQEWSEMVDGLVDIMSDDLFERCCKAHFMFALDAPAHRIKGDIGRFLDIDELTAMEVDFMRSKRLLGLITNNLKDDQWPFLEIDCVTNPASVSEALTCLGDSDPGSSYESIYMACLMREPIEKVVLAMTSNRLKRLLLEMYSLEELAPFMKTDAGLRGAMLEEAMGL